MEYGYMEYAGLGGSKLSPKAQQEKWENMNAHRNAKIDALVLADTFCTECLATVDSESQIPLTIGDCDECGEGTVIVNKWKGNKSFWEKSVPEIDEKYRPDKEGIQ